MKAPRVTLDQWRTLQAVVDHGGFAQAAEALHRSQSSVSYTVARMQDQLGVPLLRIDGRKAVLTEAGGVLLRRSRQLVKQASQLEDLAHHMEQGWEAEVRLVVDAAYPNARLVRALTAFMPQSRGCRVRLREEVLSGVEEVLLDILEFVVEGNTVLPSADIERALMPYLGPNRHFKDVEAARKALEDVYPLVDVDRHERAGQGDGLFDAAGEAEGVRPIGAPQRLPRGWHRRCVEKQLQPAQRQQPCRADRAGPGKVQMVGDEQPHRDARPIKEAVDRRDHDVEGDDGPGRDEIGGQQHAIE